MPVGQRLSSDHTLGPDGEGNAAFPALLGAGGCPSILVPFRNPDPLPYNSHDPFWVVVARLFR